MTPPVPYFYLTHTHFCLFPIRPEAPRPSPPRRSRLLLHQGSNIDSLLPGKKNIRPAIASPADSSAYHIDESFNHSSSSVPSSGFLHCTIASTTASQSRSSRAPTVLSLIGCRSLGIHFHRSHEPIFLPLLPINSRIASPPTAYSLLSSLPYHCQSLLPISGSLQNAPWRTLLLFQSAKSPATEPSDNGPSTPKKTRLMCPTCHTQTLLPLRMTVLGGPNRVIAASEPPPAQRTGTVLEPPTIRNMQANSNNTTLTFPAPHPKHTSVH